MEAFVFHSQLIWIHILLGMLGLSVIEHELTVWNDAENAHCSSFQLLLDTHFDGEIHCVAYSTQVL